MAHDLTLLRAYEPTVRFTRGEYFYPVSVERYAERSTLWSAPEDDESSVVATAGSLDLDTLVARSAGAQGVGQSLSGIVDGEKEKRARIPAADRPPRLRGGSRLAAVGLLARLIDSLNRVSLLFRGSVPGGSAARSFLLQRDHLAPDAPTYYGRLVRDGNWIICQYWFFYAFNNWRSAFGGVNEHESDWEQVTIYLDGTGELDADGLPPARWVVFAAHDETGDDLRRRWDDPDLSLIDGRHPEVFAGAGSHSGAYLAGDYLITVPAPTLGGFVQAIRWIARILTKQATPRAQEDPHEHLRHRRTPLVALGGARSRVLAGWAVISTPVILWAVSAIILPTDGVSATSVAFAWLVILLSIEGLVRGQFLAVMGRLISVLVILLALYWAVVDWRLVLGWGFAAAALLLLVVNVRDSFKR